MSVSRDLNPETRLVHAGTLRSQFGETSEANDPAGSDSAR